MHRRPADFEHRPHPRCWRSANGFEMPPNVPAKAGLTPSLQEQEQEQEQEHEQEQEQEQEHEQEQEQEQENE